MFVGSLPNPVLEQGLRCVDFSSWKRVFVACSGSFKIERALARRWPNLEITGNDVSLISCALGGLAAGRPVSFTFTGELAWLEPLRASLDDTGRVGLLFVAIAASTYASGKTNRFKEAHLAQIKDRAELLATAGREKIAKGLDELNLVDFRAGDFMALAIEAARDGQAVVAFPPTYRGGYERQYRFLAANSEWLAPTYDVFDPASMPTFLNQLDEAGAPWLVYSDQAIEGREAVSEYRAGRQKPIFGYASNARRAALTERRAGTAPFAYKPLDLSKLTHRSKVSLVPATSAQASYIKDIYLAKNIKHVPGMANLLVYIDEMLAGLMIFSLSQHQVYSPDEIYLLSDLSTLREGRLSKLIARLTLCKPVTTYLEGRFVRRFKYVVTTAFSRHPQSMKYRGVFDLLKRTETADGFNLNYGKEVSGERVETAWRWWWREHGSKLNGG